MVGLRGVCSEDVCSEVKSLWERLGYGVVIQGYRLTVLVAWTGGTWMIAKSIHEFEEAMMADLRETAQRRADLELRIARCTWAPLQRQDQDQPEPRATHNHPNLQAMRGPP